jgi:hypothetical protein
LCIFTLLLLSPLREGCRPSFEQTWIPSPQKWFVPSLVEICPVVLEKKILKYFLYIFTLLLLSPLREGRRPSYEQTWIPSPQGWFVPSLVETGPVVLEKKILKYFLYIFTLLLLSPLREGRRPSYEQTWIPSPQGWFVPSLVETGPVEKKILKYFLYIFTLLRLSPLREGCRPSFEQT